MIKSYDQCLETQKRRVKAGKRGYAKAVRRYLLKFVSDYLDYKSLKNGLPVTWKKKKPGEKK